MRISEEDRLLLLVAHLEVEIAKLKSKIAIREVQVKYGLSLDSFFAMDSGAVWYPPKQGQNDNAEGD